ncbi:toll-like receptor 3 [Fundulus heteroclitus]|uniref:toll-like receptor 3 n=1 Tax=Fundulus heteroclitus TaxID=8078 RepID=UPI00165B00AC|nr:toll-like receptor 3 [Fundulus heteroclitus]
MLHVAGSCIPAWVTLVCTFIMSAYHCTASLKATCSVQDGRADCSHRSLSSVPQDLPTNITSLDMSHNRMTTAPPDSLKRYAGLLHLNVSYNSIKNLDGGLCKNLPGLQTLNLMHNEVYLLKREDLSHCVKLTRLNMASNRLKLQDEPFFLLQSLKYLDVSMNKLKSAMLGSQPQLPSLVTLDLGHNSFSTVKREDFSFLKHSPSLEVISLISSVSLEKLEPGCFKPISGLRMLSLDGSLKGSLFISDLCSELSGTAIGVLSLRNIGLTNLTNRTFLGLKETNLTFLDLSSNHIGQIEDGSFRYLSRLQTLNLTGNNIKRLTPGTFQGLNLLKNLQLTKALVKSQKSSPVIEDFSFQPLSNLENLILQNTVFVKITENTFKGLTSLTELDLSWSSYLQPQERKISNKSFVSLADSPLRKLNLIGNALVGIEPGSFSWAKKLSVLLLSRNFIDQTFSGKEFEGLSQLQELHISNNTQKIDLTPESFANVTNLRVLLLGRSLKAETLNHDSSPFRPLSNLTVLDLSNNNIANLRENMLEGLENLRVLKLQHNNLVRLWKNANLGGPVLFLKHTPRLVSFEMDFNGMDEIPTAALRNLTQLRQLSFSNNLLNNLQDSVFDDLTSLKVLRLEKNFITAVRPEVFRTPMSNLSVLVMGKNTFDCSCESILWFVKWLNNTNTSVPGLRDQYMCNTPLLYFNHSIMDFDPLSCKDMTPFQALYILTSTVVLMLIFSALIYRFHGWRIQFYWNILINRILGFSDAKVEEGRKFEFDAYVMHAEEDTRWVERRIIPLEKKTQIRFCLDHRDSIIGMSKLESIVVNIGNSRKILFVVTEKLLKDPLCRQFKVHHALHQVIETRRDSAVLIFLQDVPDYKLSRSLFLRKGMLRQSCILNWPPQRERIPALYQKLLIALGMTNRLQE